MDHGGDHLLVFLAVALGSLITSSFAYFYIQYLVPRIMPGPSTPPPPPPPPPAEPNRPRLQITFSKLNLKDWFRKRQHRSRDEEEHIVHPPVFCIEDLEVPPPVYVRSRCNPPSEAEIRTLKEQLENLKQMRESRFGPFEKTLHRADLINLNSWIKQLERLVEKRAACEASRVRKTKRLAPTPNSGRSGFGGTASTASTASPG